MMPFAGSETPVVDPSIDVEKALRKAGPESDEPADAPAPALAAEAPVSDGPTDAPAPALASAADAPVSGDDSPAADTAGPPQVAAPTLGESAAGGEDGEADDDAIELPLRQLEVATGALLGLLLAATLVLAVRRRRAL